ESAGELPPPSDDDPITRMNKAIEASEAALSRLSRLWSPRWAGPRGVVPCALVAAGLGAAAGFPFLGPVAAAGVTAAVALVLGPALWLLVRWLGLRAALRQGKALGRHLAEAARACRLLNDHAAWEYAEERARQAERHARKKKEANEYYLPLFDAQRKQYDAELARI